MSKPSSRIQKENQKKAKTKSVDTARNDRGIYIGVVIIGAFIVMLGWLLEPKWWAIITVGYIAWVAWLVHIFALSVYSGGHLSAWKLALARLSLRWAGFGRAHGKPVEAAHGEPSARKTIVVTSIVSLVIVAGLAVLLIPQLRPWA